MESAVDLPSPRVLPWRVRLRHHHFLHFNERFAMCLRSERGTLWVTVDGRLEDIVLDAEQCRQFDAHATITVGTLGGDAVVSINAQATRPGRARHWWRLLPMRTNPPAHEDLR